MLKFVENIFKIKESICTQEPDRLVQISATTKAVQCITTTVENQKVVAKLKFHILVIKVEDNIKSTGHMLYPPQERITITAISFRKMLLVVTHILIHILKGLGFARI
jgi:hypothetical protein